MGQARDVDCTHGKFSTIYQCSSKLTRQGASGAGKTSLLNVLADRADVGVITGDVSVNGQRRSNSFQRSTGYVQQQDVHLPTSTVREALQFSALLRQPASVPKAEKLAYVEEVIGLLEMEDYGDAVVGVPGEGKVAGITLRVSVTKHE